jgi:hypothetical protein
MHPAVRRTFFRRLGAFADQILAIALGVTLAWFAAQGF